VTNKTPGQRAIAFLIVLIPALATAFLVYVRFHATLLDFQPSWNDEIYYWHQAQSFAASGLGNGYYTFNELPAKAGFSHYGPHGPLFPAIYGTLGRGFGRAEYSGPLLNLLLLALATIVFLSTTPAIRRQRLKVGLLFLTFWPILLYIPSNMQESLHAAAAIVFGAIFYRLVSRPGSLAPAWFALCAGFIFLCALMRPTWALLFIPLFWYRSSAPTPRHIWLSVGYGTLLAGVVFVIFQSLSAPYPNFMSSIADASPGGSVGVFARHFAGNVRGLVDPRNGSTLEILPRYQAVLVVALLVVAATGRCGPKLARLRTIDSHAAFHLLNLGIPLIFILFFYDVAAWKDYRVLAPHLLLSLLLWSTLGQSKLAYFIAGTNLVCALAFGLTFSRIHAEQFTPSTPVIPWAQLVAYQPQANAWCNTLLTDAALDRKLINMPPGVGLSFLLRPDDIKLPIRSQFLLLNPATYAILKERMRLQFLRNTVAGNLFGNLDCGCEPGGRQ